MAKNSKTESRTGINPASQMAFAVALCALLAAGVGMVVNHWMTGWMAVGGMVGVGLFYLAIGVLNLRMALPDYDDDATVSQHAARVDNLYGEPVALPHKHHAAAEDMASHLRVGRTELPNATETPTDHQFGR